MASAEARAKLASVAHALNAANAERIAQTGLWPPKLPPLLLMTDANRLKDSLGAVRVLPSGSGIVLRHNDDSRRKLLADILVKLAAVKGFRVLVANDPELAEKKKAAGVHFAEARMKDAADARRKHPEWLITVAAHTAEAVTAAAEAGADAALLSPVFPTSSHPDSNPLGVDEFLRIARDAPIPVYALGGVNAGNGDQLTGPNVAGIAAIDGLLPD